MYQCIGSSKCISMYHLMDNIFDCPYKDDENMINIINNTHSMEQFSKISFKCHRSNKYISRSLINNGVCDCGLFEDGWCDDEDQHSFNYRNTISFQTICDGYTELFPVMINEQMETDETECQQWVCNNIYTRCNGIWNCPHGEDEIGCYVLPELNCSSKHHLCVSPHTNQLMCLSIEKVNDGMVDCLGATDERYLCRQNDEIMHSYEFYCRSQSLSSCINYRSLCDGLMD